MLQPGNWSGFIKRLSPSSNEITIVDMARTVRMQAPKKVVKVEDVDCDWKTCEDPFLISFDRINRGTHTL